MRSSDSFRLLETSFSNEVSRSGPVSSSMAAASTSSSSLSPPGPVTAAISSSEKGPGPPGVPGAGASCAASLVSVGLLPVVTLVHLRRHQPLQGVAAHEAPRSEEHTSELQSQSNLVCRLLLEKKKKKKQK